MDVSADGGKHWTRADLVEKPIHQHRRSQWSWQFWEKEVVLSDDAVRLLEQGKPANIEIACKALNGAWNVQPATPEGHTNAHGCCVNHWYRVPVTVCPKGSCKRADPGDYENKPCGGKFKVERYVFNLIIYFLGTVSKLGPA